MNLSIIIAVQNETYLERTITRIKATCQELPELIIVFDGVDARNYAIDYPDDRLKIIESDMAQGVSFSRHIGILEASNDTVFCTDAHVDWRNGSNWAEELVRLSEQYPDDILCCKMQVIHADKLWLNNTNDRYSGAAIYPKVLDGGGYNIIAAKWKDQGSGVISAIMGAGYTFRRERYINMLSSPLRVNSGWGHDEETLSIINWLCGGCSRLIDVEIGHIANLPKRRISNDVPVTHRVWANRLSMLQYLPMKEDYRSELLEWVRKNPYVSRYYDDITSVIKTDIVDELRMHLLKTGRTFEGFIQTHDCEDDIDETQG